MRQIASSNIIYRLTIVVRAINVFKSVVIEKDVINDKTTSPAVIFAASRKLKVIGRTEILTDSIIIKK